VARVVERVEAHARGCGVARPRILLEPGRAAMADAQLLLARVAQLRDPEDGLTWAVLDVGINAAESVRSEWHQLYALEARPGAPLRRYRLTGPSCMQGDLLYPAWRLPELRPGDGVAIMDAGAYFVPFSTDFSFPRPAVVRLDGGEVRVLRRGETFDDLVALDGPGGEAR
jgi:diaminopimelate decarboxylase